MGTWGAGNFDSDGALDYIGEVADGLEDRIEECFADEESSALDEDGETVLMASVAILSVLCEHCKAPPPKPDIVARWKQRYLDIFDEELHSLETVQGYTEERRAVIEETFNKLQARADEFWQERSQ